MQSLRVFSSFLFLISLTGCIFTSKDKVSDLNFLGSKSPYQLPPQISEKIPKTCKPVHVSMISRHGSRYLTKMEPVENLIREFSDTSVLTRKGKKVHKWLQILKHSVQVGMLTKQGEDEQFGIGHRLYKRYPELFKNKNILFSTTSKSRTDESRDAFIRGLTFDFQGSDQFEFRKFGTCEDLELRYFDNCQNYKDYIKDEASKKIHYLTKKIFESETHQKNLDENLKELFQDQKINNLSSKNKQSILEDIYKLCQQDYDINFAKGDAKFCSLLNLEIRKTFKYITEDMPKYYERGPVKVYKDKRYEGINYKMSCMLLNSLMDDVQDQHNIKKNQSSHFRFAHLETLLPLGVLLGIYDVDADLDTEENSQWDIGAIGKMATNLQWVLFRCQEEDIVQYKMKMFINEREKSFPISECKDEVFCSWDLVRSFYQKRLAELGLGTCSLHEWNYLCGNGLDNGKALCLKSGRISE